MEYNDILRDSKRLVAFVHELPKDGGDIDFLKSYKYNLNEFLGEKATSTENIKILRDTQIEAFVNHYQRINFENQKIDPLQVEVLKCFLEYILRTEEHLISNSHSTKDFIQFLKVCKNYLGIIREILCSFDLRKNQIADLATTALECQDLLKNAVEKKYSVLGQIDFVDAEDLNNYVGLTTNQRNLAQSCKEQSFLNALNKIFKQENSYSIINLLIESQLNLLHCLSRIGKYNFRFKKSSKFFSKFSKGNGDNISARTIESEHNIIFKETMCLIVYCSENFDKEQALRKSICAELDKLIHLKNSDKFFELVSLLKICSESNFPNIEDIIMKAEFVLAYMNRDIRTIIECKKHFNILKSESNDFFNVLIDLVSMMYESGMAPTDPQLRIIKQKFLNFFYKRKTIDFNLVQDVCDFTMASGIAEYGLEFFYCFIRSNFVESFEYIEDKKMRLTILDFFKYLGDCIQSQMEGSESKLESVSFIHFLESINFEKIDGVLDQLLSQKSFATNGRVFEILRGYFWCFVFWTKKKNASKGDFFLNLYFKNASIFCVDSQTGNQFLEINENTVDFFILVSNHCSEKLMKGGGDFEEKFSSFLDFFSKLVSKNEGGDLVLSSKVELIKLRMRLLEAQHLKQKIADIDFAEDFKRITKYLDPWLVYKFLKNELLMNGSYNYIFFKICEDLVQKNGADFAIMKSMIQLLDILIQEIVKEVKKSLAFSTFMLCSNICEYIKPSQNCSESESKTMNTSLSNISKSLYNLALMIEDGELESKLVLDLLIASLKLFLVAIPINSSSSMEVEETSNERRQIFFFSFQEIEKIKQYDFKEKEEKALLIALAFALSRSKELKHVDNKQVVKTKHILGNKIQGMLDQLDVEDLYSYIIIILELWISAGDSCFKEISKLCKEYFFMEENILKVSLLKAKEKNDKKLSKQVIRCLIKTMIKNCEMSDPILIFSFYQELFSNIQAVEELHVYLDQIEMVIGVMKNSSGLPSGESANDELKAQVYSLCIVMTKLKRKYPSSISAIKRPYFSILEMFGHYLGKEKKQRLAKYF